MSIPSIVVIESYIQQSKEHMAHALDDDEHDINVESTSIVSEELSKVVRLSLWKMTKRSWSLRYWFSSFDVELTSMFVQRRLLHIHSIKNSYSSSRDQGRCIETHGSANGNLLRCTSAIKYVFVWWLRQTNYSNRFKTQWAQNLLCKKESILREG